MAVGIHEWCSDWGDPPGSGYWEDWYSCTHITSGTYSSCNTYASHQTNLVTANWSTDSSSPCNNIATSNYCNGTPSSLTVQVTPDSAPSAPKTTADLTCTRTSSTDPDGDPVTYTYQWYKDNVIQTAATVSGTTAFSNTISNSYTFFGDTWKCVVTPKDNQGQGNSSGPSAQDLVTIQNTPPTKPSIISTSSRNIVGGSITIYAGSAYDPDVDSAKARGQTFTYSGDVFVYGSSPVFSNASPTCRNLSCTSSFTKSLLDRTKDNCAKLKVTDGFSTATEVANTETDYNCIPVIDSLTIANSTSGEAGALAGTKWIKNHFGGADPYEEISCTFKTHDRDNVDLRSASSLSYTMILFAQPSGKAPAPVYNRTGTVASGGTIIEKFIDNNYPGTLHSYPIGTRFFCEVKVSDGFFGDDINSFTGNNWAIKGPLEGDKNAPIEGYIEVVNTIPTKTLAQTVDRYVGSSELRAPYSSSLDPDVFSTADGGQELNYYGRLFEKDKNAGYYGTNLAKGDFNSTVRTGNYPAWIGTLTVPLISEREFCSEGRSFDGLEYSPVSDKNCSYETPFKPVCPNSFGLNMDVAQVTCDAVLNKAAVVLNVTCSKDVQMDEDWKVGITGVKVTQPGAGQISSTLGNSITDCNGTPQTLFVTFDSSTPSAYTLDFNHGGVYNGEAIYCSYTKSASFDSGDCTSSSECAANGLSAAISDYSNTASGMNLQFTFACSGTTTNVTGIQVLDKSNSQRGTSGAVSLPCAFVASKTNVVMDSNANATYFANIKYGANCTHAMIFHIADNNTVISGPGSDMNVLIPDASIISAVLALLAVAIIVARKRK